MTKHDMNVHRETLERYCHVIGENTLVCRTTKDGCVSYRCVNRPSCDKCGGCRNSRYHATAFTDGEGMMT